MSVIRRLQVCLNGGRGGHEHPGVPLTPARAAASALAAVAAGAEAVHLHPRDTDGRESLSPADVGAAVTAVRRAGVPVGVSTGLWITGDVAARHQLVASWAGLPGDRRPDVASVNVSEPGWAELTAVLRDAGIAVEAGVWSVADAEALAGTRPDVCRVLVEIFEEPAAPAADAVLDRLDALGVTAPRLLHGERATCWPLVAHAARRGLPTRIGFEDTLTGPGGEPVEDNADLVRHALAVLARV